MSVRDWWASAPRVYPAIHFGLWRADWHAYEALLALPFGFAHQPKQHLGQIVKHLAPCMANHGKQQRLTAWRHVLTQL